MSGKYLRQSTASQTRTVGPFVDDTDFKTAEDALTINASDIRLKKNGAADVAKNSGGATADVNGQYAVTWDATDTDTVGELHYSIKVAGALQVFGSYTVLEEAIYDALFAASANAFTGAAGSTKVTGVVLTDTLTTYTGNTPQTGDSYAIVNSGTHGNAALKTLIDAVDNFVDTEIADIQSRLPAALTAGGNIKADALAWNGLTTVALPLAPTVAGRSLDVTAGGNAGIDWANVTGTTTLVDLSATTIGAVSAVNGSVAVGSIAAGAITAAVIADGAIDAATFAADALAAFQQEATDALNAYAPATPAQVNAEVLDVLNVDTLIDGKTFVQAVQYVSAITAGRVSGAGTGTEVFKGLDEATTRVTVTVDGSGNRTDIVYG